MVSRFNFNEESEFWPIIELTLIQKKILNFEQKFTMFNKRYYKNFSSFYYIMGQISDSSLKLNLEKKTIHLFVEQRHVILKIYKSQKLKINWWTR